MTIKKKVIFTAFHVCLDTVFGSFTANEILSIIITCEINKYPFRALYG